MEKKNNNLKLWIMLGVLITCLGTSVAFFVSGIDFLGDGANVDGDTGDFVEVTYDAGSSNLSLLDAVPGSSSNKGFQVKVKPNSTNDEVTYAIKLNITNNTFSYGVEHLEEIKYTLTEEITGKEYTGYIPLGTNKEITLANITKQEETETTYNYNLKIEFLNIDASQNHNQNKSINASLKVEFSEGEQVSDILAKYTKDDSRSGQITAPFTGNTPTTVYSKEDDNGTSYMFAGVNPNNWVKLGNLYFRIIRFNGDGTMRLIYSGEGSPATTGSGTQIGTSKFNTSYNDNMYVGLQYTSGQVHGNGTNSGILGTSTSTDLTTLYGWYNNKVKPSYASLIDSNAGFCSDRDNYTNTSGTTSGGGTGTTTTYYGAYIRYVKGGSWQTTYIPTLRCKNASDNLKLPVGLITADEYMLAGGGALVSGYYNTTFWLHTGQTYWTMSPSILDTIGFV